MSSSIAAYIRNCSTLIERALATHLPVSRLGGAELLNEALQYAVIPGGRRMRPVLAILAGEMCGASTASLLPVACALEFLHASSLIFDDLPSMDDAFLRHSRPCLHLKFGEGTAILAGLALMNEAYAILASVPLLLARATHEIGVAGMIGGQAGDVAGAHSRDRLEKTTALTRLTMLAGGYVAQAETADLNTLAFFGEALGEAYQICDDISDCSDAHAVPGKTSGQDRRHGRWSFVDELGMEGCKARVHHLIDSACESLGNRFAGRGQVNILEEFARGLARHIEKEERVQRLGAHGPYRLAAQPLVV